MKILRIEPFDFNLYYFTDVTECIQWVREKHPFNDYPDYQDTIDKLHSSLGLFIEFNKDPIFAIYAGDSSCLDHEIIHATWYILSYAGVQIDKDNHEIQCYLFEHIKRLILENN